MKKYAVTLIRKVTQTCVVNVTADNGIDAVDNAIASQGVKDWQDNQVSETGYREVKVIDEDPVPEANGKEKNITTRIYTYDVELDVSYDGDDLVSSCFVSKTRGRTLYCSSLALLDDQGTIEGDNWGDVIQVPNRVVAKIFEWAEENGY